LDEQIWSLRQTTARFPFKHCGGLVLLLLIGYTSHAHADTFDNCRLTLNERLLAELFIKDSKQKRKREDLECDPVLTKVARAQAADMAKRNFFASVNPDGIGPNYLVRKAGYQLPDWWDTDKKINSIESIAAGYPQAADAWKAFLKSEGHRVHVNAEDVFFTNQTSFGIGWAYLEGSTYKNYWVIITAPKEPDPCLRNLDSLSCRIGDTDKDGQKNWEDPLPEDACNGDPRSLTCGTGDADSDGLSNDEERAIGKNPEDPCDPEPLGEACVAEQEQSATQSPEQSETSIETQKANPDLEGLHGQFEGCAVKDSSSSFHTSICILLTLGWIVRRRKNC